MTKQQREKPSEPVTKPQEERKGVKVVGGGPQTGVKRLSKEGERAGS